MIKKHNLQPASVGDVKLGDDNLTLASDSPVIDKGLNPSSSTYKALFPSEKVYNSETDSYEMKYPEYDTMVELLHTDFFGNQRIHNETIDIGAMEYGASK